MLKMKLNCIKNYVVQRCESRRHRQRKTSSKKNCLRSKDKVRREKKKAPQTQTHTDEIEFKHIFIGHGRFLIMKMFDMKWRNEQKKKKTVKSSTCPQQMLRHHHHHSSRRRKERKPKLCCFFLCWVSFLSREGSYHTCYHHFGCRITRILYIIECFVIFTFLKCLISST